MYTCIEVNKFKQKYKHDQSFRTRANNLIPRQRKMKKSNKSKCKGISLHKTLDLNVYMQQVLKLHNYGKTLSGTHNGM